MIEESLKKILETEQEAEEMLKLALEDAKHTVAHADERGEKIRSEAREKVKTERKKMVAQASQDADIEYDIIVVEGEKKCNLLKKRTDIKKAALYISEKVFEKHSGN